MRPLKSTCSVFLVLLTVAGMQLVTGAEFDTVIRSRRYMAQEGQKIAIQCSVRDQGNHDISWWYMQHNTQISHNRQILTNNSRFQVLTPPGGDGVWNLQISNIQKSDHGFYQCRIDGTVPLQVQANFLIVEGKDNPGRPTQITNVNFTDCCIKEGVRPACLPVCYPSTLSAEFQYDQCETDLLKLIKCGADGRNHAPCCFRRELPGQCLGFCTNEPPVVVDGSYLECLDRAEEIVSCYEEGHMILPSPPQLLTITATAPYSISLSWSAPAENANTVTAYKIAYKLQGDMGYKTTIVMRQTTATIDQLLPNTRYTVHVTALNPHGSSLPSYTVSGFTSQDGPTIPGSNRTLLDCCIARGVSEVCQPVLCGAQIGQINSSLTMQCLSHYDKVSACLAGEKNHSACCKERGIPDHCQPVCAGQGFSNYSQLDCITTLMPAISSCFIENTDKLPGPPANVHLARVSDSSIVVEWAAPESHPEKAEKYVLMYRAQRQGTYREVVLSPTVTSYTLTNLESATFYDIQLLANNSAGTSLPTPTVTALTNYNTDGAIRRPTPSPGPAVEWTDPLRCCQARSVSSMCEMLCHYDADFTSFDTHDILVCSPEIAQILACGSNGRNNTECCRRKGVDNSCSQFCSMTHEQAESFSLSATHVPCVFSIFDIVECMQVGQALTPSPPQNLTVATRSTNTLTVGWFAPTNFVNIPSRYYILRIRPVGTDYWNATGVGLSVTHTFQNLKPDTSYQVQVLARNGNGTSLPSPTVTARTLQAAGSSVPPLLPNTNITIPSDVLQCCVDKGVSEQCRPACRGASISPQVCNSSLSGLLTCAADGRDHTACCRRLGIPRACQPYCAGRTPDSVAAVLCLAFTEQLITCYHEGQKNLPSRPRSMSLQAVDNTTITLSWAPPADNGANVKYVLFYHKDQQEQYTYIEGVTSPYTIKNLIPDTFYTISVYAVNDDGSSQPTDKYTVRTLQDIAPTIQILQSPPGFLRVGQNATLTCVATGDPYPQTGWLQRDGSVRVGATLHLNYVTDAMTDGYTCVAMTGTRRWTQVWYLKVQTAPSVTPFASIVYTTPNVGASAFLVCQFTGHPDAFTWKKGNLVISTGQRLRYRTRQKEDAVSGTVDYGLEIQNVVTSDLTQYVCTGSNGVGSPASARVQLMDSIMQGTFIPPISPGAAVNNITECCIRRGVSDLCRDSCSWRIDIGELERQGRALPCLGELDHLVECAADGKDHTACCMKNDVPPACMSFCAGNVPAQLDIDHLVCLQHINTILTCMQQGKKVPGEPQNVHAQLTDAGYIEVFWLAPIRLPQEVNKYRVYWSAPGQDHKSQDVDKDQLSYTIQGIHSHSTYTVWVTAHNQFGNSRNSSLINLRTQEFKPSAPQNLRAKAVGSEYIRLDWDNPQEHAGAVLYYRVYYRAMNALNNPYSVVNTTNHENTFRLYDLTPNTKYEIYVQAVSSHFESARSNIQVVTSGAGPQKQTASDNSAGLAAGLAVFFVLLILLVVAAIVAFWYFRIRKTPQRFKDTVAFENPGYATVGGAGAPEGTVHGIPNGNFKDGDQQHSKQADALPAKNASAIMRETPAEETPVYTSLADEGATNPVYATLDAVHSDGVDLNLSNSTGS